MENDEQKYKNIRRIGVFAIALVVIMMFVSASNFTGELEEKCEVVETCEDVLVGVSCVNKSIETCEDVCSIKVVAECHEEIIEVCEEVCEEVCSEQCDEVINVVCKDVEKEICEHINCFEEVIENCDGVIEQKECVIETICNVPNVENLTDSQTFPSDEGSSVEGANELLSPEKVVGEVQTTLDLIIDKIESFVGSIVKLSATLVDGNNTPISEKEIEFYSDETIIGSEFTNFEGIAEIDWNVIFLGEYNFSVIFEGDEIFEGTSIVLEGNFVEIVNDSVENFTEVNDSLNLNISITNETGSFYWTREIVNEYGDVNESISVRLKVPKKLKQITDEIDLEEIEFNNEEKVKLLKEILDEELKSEYEEVELNPEIDEIKNIKFNDLEIIDDRISLGIEEVNDSDFVQSYAIDPTQLNFTDAVVTVIAKGTELYKCKDWNFSLGECYGKWVLFKDDLIPGEEYTFTLTRDDPGFGEIIAIDAVHLDSNYSFISNVYDEVRELDGIWSEVINDSEFVRVTFEENLTNGNVIDVYVRGNGSFDIFEMGEVVSLGDSGEIDSFNGEWRYIILENMTGFADIFDFKVSGSLEFDYIHDASSGSVSVRVIQSTDDAEEAIDGPNVGDMEIDSSDLEMVEDLDFQAGNQELGLRFQNVDIPQGATIDNAYIEFEVDETNTVTTNLQIYGEDADDPITFSVANDITGRTKTTAFASWNNIPAWNTVSEKQQSTDISNVVKEIVDRSGWVANNSMVFIINGTGKRVAEAWDGESANAPLLVVNWSVTSNNVPNITSIILNSTLGTNLTSENLTVYTDQDNNASLKLIYDWKKNSSSIAILNTPFEGGSTSTFTKDYSDVSKNGTVVGATYNSTGGYDGKGAYEFDGDDRIKFVDQVAPPVRWQDMGGNSAKYTYVARIKCDGCGAGGGSFGSVNAPIFHIRRTPGSNQHVFSFGINSGKFGVGRHFEGTSQYIVTAASVNDNQWHDVAAVVDNDAVSLFLDGAKSTGAFTVTNDTSIGNVAACAFVGQRATNDCGASATLFFNGTIDDLLIFDFALSDEQIFALQNNRTDLIVSQETVLGETWEVDVTPNDGSSDGTTVTSNGLTILNGLPSINSLVLNSTFGTNLTSENLTAHATTSDPENYFVKVIYDWKLEGNSIAVLNMPFEGGSNGTFTKDYSEFGNNGNVSGAIYNATEGYDGRGAYDFGGSDDVILQTNDNLDILGDLTISVWGNYDDLSSSANKILTRAGDGETEATNYLYTIALKNDTTMRIFWEHGAGINVDITSSATFSADAGEWHHYAVVRDSSAKTVKFYIDGAELGTAQSYSNNPTGGTSSFLTIGAGPTLTSEFDGMIDDLIIFNKSLSSEQISALYNNRTDLIVSQETQVNDTWEVLATPNDGTVDGTSVLSNNLTILSGLDIISPVVSLNSPANDAVLTSSQVTFNCSVTDDGGLKNMTLYLSESNGSVDYVEYILNYSVWKYNDSDVYPAADWFNESYNDSSWPSGAARIGVESVAGWLNTTLDGGGDTYPSYYFRTTFNVDSILDVINMSFNIDYDDGYVVYLNGHEINRSNSTIGVDETDHSALTAATHNWACDGDTPPTCTPGQFTDPVWPKITLNSTHLSYLHDGENVLAVLIKQRTSGSSDAMLMLNLYGYERQYPALQANETKNISGTINESIFTLNLNNSYYSWNCLAYDSSGNSDWGDNNRSLRVNPANNLPNITLVNSIVDVTLTQFGTSTSYILVNVTDPDGFGDLNDSLAWCAFSRSGEATRNSSGCTGIDQSGNILAYNCSVDMQFYDEAGLWNVQCYVEDVSGGSDDDTSKTVIVNGLNHIVQNITTINWDGLDPGVDDQEALEQLEMINGGNQEYTNFNISSHNATLGSNIIEDTRFMIDSQAGQTTGQTRLNSSGIDWNEGILSKCTAPCSTNSTETMYFYVDTPAGIIGGVYSSIVNWTIAIS